MNGEELETLFVEIEGVVNKRPLTFLSEEEPFIPLRPIDFLLPLRKNHSPEIEEAGMGEDGFDNDPDYLPPQPPSEWTSCHFIGKRSLNCMYLLKVSKPTI